jgi:hypothetical protein
MDVDLGDPRTPSIALLTVLFFFLKHLKMSGAMSLGLLP